jgi:hypothetical protein
VVTRSAIVIPAISEYVAQTRELCDDLHSTESQLEVFTRAVESQQQAVQAKRMLLGRQLLKVRAALPKRSNVGAGWSAFLEAVELSETTAWRYMKLAEATLDFTPGDQLPTMGELGLTTRESPQPDPESPPPSDDDAPVEQLALEEAIEQAEAAKPSGNRDAWCTPRWLTEALPRVDLDPCSNPYSTVSAETVYMLEAGQDGLELPWFGLVWINGPYSDLEPWARKLDREYPKLDGCAFLVNTSNTPAWWHLLVKHLRLRLDFDKRIEFAPPPGVEPSRNDRDQCMVMDAAFWAKCDQDALLSRGTLWRRE